MTVTPLTRFHALGLASIEALSNRSPWSERLFASEFDLPHSNILGIEEAGELRGFLILHLLFDEAYIVNLAVHPDFRRQGLGKHLLEAAIVLAEGHGAASISLEVRESNFLARSLYASYRFVEVGVRPRYYADDGEDALILTRVTKNV